MARMNLFPKSVWSLNAKSNALASGGNKKQSGRIIITYYKIYFNFVYILSNIWIIYYDYCTLVVVIYVRFEESNRIS